MTAPVGFFVSIFIVSDMIHAQQKPSRAITSVALHTCDTMKVENMRNAKKRWAIIHRRERSSQGKGSVGVNRLFSILSRMDSDHAILLLLYGLSPSLDIRA